MAAQSEVVLLLALLRTCRPVSLRFAMETVPNAPSPIVPRISYRFMLLNAIQRGRYLEPASIKSIVRSEKMMFGGLTAS
jgi:hypothetical protein